MLSFAVEICTIACAVKAGFGTFAGKCTLANGRAFFFTLAYEWVLCWLLKRKNDKNKITQGLSV